MGVIVANVRERTATWAASLPESFGPADGVAAADRALGEARGSVRTVKWSYSGTIPPSPWPATPELVRAMDRMQAMRDGFEVFARRTPAQRWPRNAGKVGPAFLQVGAELYQALGAFEAKAAAAKSLTDLIAKIPDPRSMFLGFPIWMVVVGGVLFIERGRLRSLLRLQ